MYYPLGEVPPFLVVHEEKTGDMPLFRFFEHSEDAIAYADAMEKDGYHPQLYGEI